MVFVRVIHFILNAHEFIIPRAKICQIEIIITKTLFRNYQG